MVVFISIKYKTVAMNKQFYKAVVKYNDIELVGIYPHRLFLGMDIQYIDEERVYVKTLESKDVTSFIFSDIFDTVLLNALFDSISKVKFIIIVLDENIAIFNVLNLITNITTKLKAYNRELKTNKE